MARSRVETDIEQDSGDPFLYLAHGQALAGLGQYESAIEAGRRAIELAPRSAPVGAELGLHVAQLVFIRAGAYDEALQHLGAYLEAPGRWSIEGLLAHPLIDPIRNDPGFLALVEKHRRD